MTVLSPSMVRAHLLPESFRKGFDGEAQVKVSQFVVRRKSALLVTF